MTGFVYFVRAGADGPVKIGVSESWQRRIATLQTAHHERLEVLLVLAAIAESRGGDVRSVEPEAVRPWCCDRCDIEKRRLAARWPSAEWTQEHSCDGLARFEAALSDGYVLSVQPTLDVWLDGPRGGTVFQSDCWGPGDRRDVDAAIESAFAAHVALRWKS